MDMRFRFAIDRGGTFTDVVAEVVDPDGAAQSQTVVSKLLSEDPSAYDDAPTEAIRRILDRFGDSACRKGERIPSKQIESIRMGTTVATNALLERKGEKFALVVTKGFRDILKIGDQSRPEIFDLEVKRPEILFEDVVEVDERIRIRHPREQLQENAEIRVGVTKESVVVLKKPDLDEIRKDLEAIKQKGIRSLCVAFLHSYTFPEHEQIVGKLARDMGFENVSLSSDLVPMIKIVPRAFTACADAYLTPCIQIYISKFVAGFDADFLKNVNVQFMQSDGGLTSIRSFCGYRAVLSGPAGGIVGYSKTAAKKFGNEPVIGFDMGGTSTDVSRFDGALEHVFENITAGIAIQAPQLEINTVAAGGGSRLYFRSGLFVVGPDSAGANPGPACYRLGGPLAITDANLILGRIRPEYFPNIFGPNRDEPLSYEASRLAFENITQEINNYYNNSKSLSIEEVALGFIRVANEAMCRPIRSLTQAKGFDTSAHHLAVFGGAGGQHACDVAKNLGISSIYIHRLASVLSAYGIGLADVVHEEQEPSSFELVDESLVEIDSRLAALEEKARHKLMQDGFPSSRLSIKHYLNLRYEGTDTCIMIAKDHKNDSYSKLFEDRYLREHGFSLSRPIVVDDIRVRVIGISTVQDDIQFCKENISSFSPKEITRCFFEYHGWLETKVFDLSELPPLTKIEGPALILDSNSTVLIDPSCIGEVTEFGHIHIKVTNEVNAVRDPCSCDPILLSIFSHRFMSIAEQMGRTLQRTAISTNIKERLDFSCAIFGPDGGLVANAPHLPVHLGSMQEAVRFQMKYLGSSWKPGEVILTNHPQAGGSHLPDITTITPVYNGESEPIFFLASRGHHADIGGISPGSMPPFSKKLSEEGAAIISMRIVEGQSFNEAQITEELSRAGSRCLSDSISDLRAQVSANEKGSQLVQSLIQEFGLETVHSYMKFIQEAAENAVRDRLKILAKENQSNVLESEDFMDDGTIIKLKITINENDGSAIFDFTGTGHQVYGNWNSPKSVVYSAIIYCLRSIVKEDIPLNQGCLLPIKVIIPSNCILNPTSDAAVVGGNVLTSQRVTDVLLKAFKACAASQGCMNNLTFGDSTFGYYETIAGGAGAGPSWNGQSGVHTHMTNTRITDPEILEKRYPVQLNAFHLRYNSGGEGKFRGGDGVVREIKLLKPLSVGILSERRVYQPYGLHDGKPGKCGMNILIRASDGISLNLGGKNQYEANTGDIIRILSPGGGGFGSADL